MTDKDSKTETTVQINEVRHADDARLAELGYKSEFRREFSVSKLDASCESVSVSDTQCLDSL